MTTDVVITGLGIISPIGIGAEPFWASLLGGVSGVRPLTLFDATGLPVGFGGEVRDFDPKEFVKPRKSLKVMSRDIQFGVSAADQAVSDAGIAPGAIDPDRFGVVYGADMIFCPLDDLEAAFRGARVGENFDFKHWAPQALAHMYPLWLLRYLPNMASCHVAIAHDARGHNNSLTAAEVSSLLAVGEAARIIQRGRADVMIVGGASSRIHPTTYVRSCIGEISHRADCPPAASRPFDASRDGSVNGEGSAAFVLESREHATRRGARILGRVLGHGSAFESTAAGKSRSGSAICSSIATALAAARLTPADIGHVNAHGLSTIADDRIEARAIREMLGDVPVTAPKSFFGNLGAGSGAVEMAVSLLALGRGTIPPTLNYEQPDPFCPVNVVHGGGQRSDARTALLLNQAPTGQAAAVVIATE